MNIFKIKTVNKGLKGLEVDYRKVNTAKDGRAYNSNHWIEKLDPINMALEKSIQALTYHFLEICGYIHESTTKEEKDQLMLTTTVTGITFSKDDFLITGQKEVFETKIIVLNTPNVNVSDGYHAFDVIMKMIDEVVVETELYLENKKKISDEELAVRYIQNNKNSSVDLETFKNMNAEEQKEFATSILEKMGCVVMENEEVQVDSVDISAEINQAQEKIKKGKKAKEVIDLNAEPILVPGI